MIGSLVKNDFQSIYKLFYRYSHTSSNVFDVQSAIGAYTQMNPQLPSQELIVALPEDLYFDLSFQPAIVSEPITTYRIIKK